MEGGAGGEGAGRSDRSAHTCRTHLKGQGVGGERGGGGDDAAPVLPRGLQGDRQTPLNQESADRHYLSQALTRDRNTSFLKVFLALASRDMLRSSFMAANGTRYPADGKAPGLLFLQLLLLRDALRTSTTVQTSQSLDVPAS